jgi:hypothetical protein
LQLDLSAYSLIQTTLDNLGIQPLFPFAVIR